MFYSLVINCQQFPTESILILLSHILHYHCEHDRPDQLPLFLQQVINSNLPSILIAILQTEMESSSRPEYDAMMMNEFSAPPSDSSIRDVVIQIQVLVLDIIEVISQCILIHTSILRRIFITSLPLLMNRWMHYVNWFFIHSSFTFTHSK